MKFGLERMERKVSGGNNSEESGDKFTSTMDGGRQAGKNLWLFDKITYKIVTVEIWF